MEMMSNKKGSGLFDVYVIFVFLFITFITAGICLYAYNAFNDAWQAQPTELVGANSQAEAGDYNALFRAVMDGAIIFWFVILWVGSLITAFYLDNAPVFYVLFFLLGLMSFFALLPLSNAADALWESDLAPGFSVLPMSYFILSNLVYFIAAFLISNGLALYAKTKQSQ